MQQTHLILMDIDGTMLVTGGVGVRAMELAGQDLFGPGFSSSGIDFAGRLDPILFNEMFAREKMDASAEAHGRFRARYVARLQALITQTPKARALPGVPSLLEAIRRDQRCVLGLLTGNFAETGSMKLRHCGIDPALFEIAVWGDESPHDPPLREHLPPVAMSRYAATRGREINAGSVVVVGDTPHDIRCAGVHGCRSVGVATGRFTTAELRAAGADAVFADLADTAAVMSVLAPG